jgi:4-hydroxy-tetrahydrodipicolinate reductase
MLGTPLLTDPFHADRWDYIFTIRRPGHRPQRRSVVVLFDGDVVRSIEAPDLPSEREFVASISRIKNPREAALELTEDERKALPPPARREAPALPSPVRPGAQLPAAGSRHASPCRRSSPSPAPRLGRMGRMLVEAVLASPDCTLAGALDVPGSPRWARTPAPLLGRRHRRGDHRRPGAGLRGADVLIDFTRPEGTLAHLAPAPSTACKLVIGTTGFDAEQKAQIAAPRADIGIVFAPNMSVGVNVVLKLLDMAAKRWPGLRHRDHRGAPPPQGRRAQRHRAEDGRGDGQARSARPEGLRGLRREGHTGERDAGTIGFATVRGGDIVGDHTVLFAGTGERIEITHKSSSRADLRQGSLRAARFLAGRGPACTAWTTCSASAGVRRQGADWLGLLGAERRRRPRGGLLLLAMSVSAWVADPLEGWLLRRAAADIARAVPAFWEPPRWPTAARGWPRWTASDLLLPLLDAATAQPAAGTLETTGRPLGADTRGCATRCTAAWRTCRPARCCWPRWAARRPSSACSAPSGASTTRWWHRRQRQHDDRQGLGPGRRGAGDDGRRHRGGDPGGAGLQRLRQRIAACEAELEGFAHDLREMVLGHDVARRRGRLTHGFGRLERSPGSRPMSDINVTPLIDVMLVLLVIFIITAPLMVSSLKLDLPKADGAPSSDAPAFLALALDAEGRLFLGEQPIAAPALADEARAARSATPPPRCSCAPTPPCPTAAWPS